MCVCRTCRYERDGDRWSADDECERRLISVDKSRITGEGAGVDSISRMEMRRTLGNATSKGKQLKRSSRLLVRHLPPTVKHQHQQQVSATN